MTKLPADVEALVAEAERIEELLDGRTTAPSPETGQRASAPEPSAPGHEFVHDCDDEMCLDPTACSACGQPRSAHLPPAPPPEPEDERARLVAELRERHNAGTRSITGDCRTCGEPGPCRAERAAALLERDGQLLEQRERELRESEKRWSAGCIGCKATRRDDGSFGWTIRADCPYHARAALNPRDHSIPWNCPTYWDGCNCAAMKADRDSLRTQLAEAQAKLAQREKA